MPADAPKPISATHIQQNLYIGGAQPTGPELHRSGIDVIVLCAYELQHPPGHFPGLEVIYCPLEDDSSKPVGIEDWTAVVRTAERVSRRVRAGKCVLVTCAMGLNRSGIVTAAAVHFLTGVSGSRAAAYVARRRVVGGHHALYNQAFVKALETRLPARVGLPVAHRF